MFWEQAFERDKHAVARAVHEAWAAEKIKQGYADHPLALYCTPRWKTEMLEKPCAVCDLSREKHHPYMLDYDDLSPEIQEYAIVTARIVYPLAFEAGRASVPPTPDLDEHESKALGELAESYLIRNRHEMSILRIGWQSGRAYVPPARDLQMADHPFNPHCTVYPHSFCLPPCELLCDQHPQAGAQ